MSNIREDLNIIKTEEQSEASQQAKRKGLKYAGFGRYVDPKTQQVTHVVQNEKLVPFNRAVKTNTFQTTNGDDYGMFGQFMSPQIQELHQILTTTYSPDKFDDAELNAIYAYTSDAYPDVNARLATVPAGTPANRIEKSAIDDTIPEFVATLDSAMKRVRAPTDFMTYVNIGDGINPGLLRPGSSFRFRSFRNSSINITSVLNATQPSQTSVGGRPQLIVLQMLVPKNSRGVYAADFAPNAEDGEFILPRGTSIEIVGQPSNIIGSNAMTGDLNLEVLYIDCKVKS